MWRRTLLALFAGVLLPQIASAGFPVADIQLNKAYFQRGDTLEISLSIDNGGGDETPADAYIAVNIGDEFLFWPNWSSNVVGYPFVIEAGWSTGGYVPISSFLLDIPGRISGDFYFAVTNRGTLEILSLASVAFDYYGGWTPCPPTASPEPTDTPESTEIPTFSTGTSSPATVTSTPATCTSTSATSTATGSPGTYTDTPDPQTKTPHSPTYTKVPPTKTPGDYTDTPTRPIVTKTPTSTPVSDTFTPSPAATGTPTPIVDQYEPDDTPEDAKEISVDETRQVRTINPKGDLDYLFFHATGSMTYIIRTYGGYDTTLTLFDTDGVTLLAYNDDGGGEGSLSLIEWYCPSGDDGTYYILAKFFWPDESGEYEVSVKEDFLPSPTPSPTFTPTATPQPGDDYEPDNRPHEAKSISADGALQNRTISPWHDVDFISFEAKSEVVYHIEIVGPDDTDTNMYLLGADGQSVIAYNEDINYPNVMRSEIFWACPSGSAGTRFIVVGKWYQTPTLNYSIRVRTGGSAEPPVAADYDAYEPDNMTGLASDIVFNDLQARTVDPEGDIDFAWVDGTEGTDVIIETYGSSDTYLMIYDDLGSELLAYDDDSGTDFNARLEVSFPYTGRFLVVAFMSAWSEERTGPYELTMLISE